MTYLLSTFGRLDTIIELSMGMMKPKHWQRRRSLGHTAGWASRLMLVCLLVLFSTFFFFTNSVQAQPVILPSSLPNGQVGTSYTATLVAAPLTPPCTWTITSGSLPPGLGLNAASGTISGTPTATGTYAFFVTVTDTIGPSAQQGFSITIASPPLTFTTTSLPAAKEGNPYSASLRVSGGTSPYTWTIISGTLPTGLVLNVTAGYISGTPLPGTAGFHSFIIGVTDSSSPALSGQRSFSLLIEKGSYEPIVTIGSGLKAGETKVYVGATPVATLRGGESVSISFDLGTTHSIGVDSIVEHPTETGIRFKAEADRITVSELSLTASFPYYTEYYIGFETDPSDAAQLTGSGWYKEGYTLRVSAPTEVEIADEPGTQYRFSNWWLPTGETVSDKNLSLTVSMAGSCIANYNTYYLLTLTSTYGETEGSAWYKAGSQAEWGMASHEVRMPGILGLFGGKYQAVNPGGTKLMDGPKTIAVDWEPNYTMPAILIPLAILLIIFGSYGLYLLWRGLQPKPVPVAPPFQAMPPPQTTVVMIGEKAKQTPPSTREQLMEQFGQLLQKYEDEITASKGAGGPPRIETVREGKRLRAPEATPPHVVEGEVIPEEEDALCSFTSKKLLRTVASSWRQAETRTITPLSGGRKAAASSAGLAVVWARDIYQEWEILDCSLPRGHKEPHEGISQIVYSLLNSITEEKVYEPKQEPRPPEPHYTDGMPKVEVADDQIISPDQLPSETMS